MQQHIVIDRVFNCLLCGMILMGIKGFSKQFDHHLKTAEKADHYVILVHGLRGTSADFKSMEKDLNGRGLNTISINYPSSHYPIETLADSAFDFLDELRYNDNDITIHFVAHSLGGILVRFYLQHHPLANLGRVVLLSVPNHGTELINAFGKFWLFRRFNGPAAMQTAAGSEFLRRLEEPNYQVGVMMSTKSINLMASRFIPGADDGRLSIESAKLSNMADFILLNCNHHVIMKKKTAIDQTIHFLKRGEFDHDGAKQVP